MSSLPWDRQRTPRPRRFAKWRGARVWKIAGLLFLVLGAAALVAGYAAHRHFLEKAGEYNLTELGQMESASTIFDRRRQVFGHIYLQNREPITLAQMPQDLQNAVIAVEDSRYYSHTGSDFRGIVRAALKNFRSTRIKQGASTITQQLARNSLPLGGKTFGRKILEIYVAHRIEMTLTKDQILEYYLNRIYLGSGLYGVEAASRGYFGKPARELALGEAATLAGMIKSPTYLSPWNNKQRATEQRDFVLGRMMEEGKISRAQAETTIGEPLIVKPRTFASAESYAVEAVRQQVIAQVGADEAVSKGYKIYTTFDADIQRAAETALRQRLDEAERNPAFAALNHQTYAAYQQTFREEEKKVLAIAAQNPKAMAPNVHANLADPAYLQGALIAVNNADGGVVALVGGRDFKHSEYNRALSPSAKRPMGTSFTPFVYAAAYQKGISPATLFLDQVIDNRQVMIGGQTGILGEWGVERVDNKFDGPLPANVALIKGKNSATVRVGNEVGLDNVLALGKRAGFVSELRQFPATFLGSSEMPLAELVLAYTAFPNGGWRPSAPFLINKIEDADGNIVYQHKFGPRVRVVDEIPAYQVHHALGESLRWGSAEAATGKLGMKFPAGSVGGKTGTAYNFTDATFCGYDQEITCAVWTGFDAPRTPIYRGAFGNEMALPIWAKVMNTAMSITPAREIPRPPGLKKYDLCSRSGDLATENCVEIAEGTRERRRTVYTEYLVASQAPRNRCGLHDGSGNPRVLALSTFSGRVNVRSGGGNTLGFKGQQVRKATAAVDLSQFQPVAVKAPTVLGAEIDPYGAVLPQTGGGAGRGSGLAAGDTTSPSSTAGERSLAADNTTPPAAAVPPPEKEVRRASPVSPFEQETANRPVQIDKPAPLEFN